MGWERRRQRQGGRRRGEEGRNDLNVQAIQPISAMIKTHEVGLAYSGDSKKITLFL